jgi:hypothetical protein
MAVWKVTFNILVLRASWTEIHYLGSKATFSAALTAAQQYCNLRAALLGNGASIQGARVSTVPASGTVDDVDPNSVATTGTWPSDPTNLVYASCLPNACALVSLLSTMTNSNYYMAGLPSSFINTEAPKGKSINVAEPPGFNIMLNAFLRYLCNNGPLPGGSITYPSDNWGTLTRRATTLLPVSAPLTTNGAVPAMIGVITSAPISPDAVAGSKVLLKGWRRINTASPGLSGVWTLGANPIVAGGTYTYFLYGSGFVSTTNFKALGKIGYLSPGLTFTPYYNYAVEKGITKKRGGSYGAPRGRSSRRR